MTAEVDALKSTNADQAAKIATLTNTNVAIAADSKTHMRDMQAAYEVSTGRVLQLLLL
jgi:hypothetical protein